MNKISRTDCQLGEISNVQEPLRNKNKFKIKNYTIRTQRSLTKKEILKNLKKSQELNFLNRLNNIEAISMKYTQSN